MELDNPSVEGDELVAVGDRSVSLEDVLVLEVRGFSMDRTILLVLGTVVIVPVALIAWVLIDCDGQSIGMC